MAVESSANAVLAGGGELGRRMRSMDWARTPLGPVESWPQSLRTCVRILLTSRQPMFVWWGEQLINLYNDAYISFLGGKHPAALGRPASEVWREIWADVGPRAAQAMVENTGTFDEALLLIVERNGYREETYCTFSYSPVPGDTGGPGGILCASCNATPSMFGERQQALLHEVATRAASGVTVEAACEAALGAFSADREDLPFAMLYLVEGHTARLAHTAGIAADHPLVPPVIPGPGGGAACVWPVDEVLAGAPLASSRLDGLGARDLPSGAWSQPPSEAIAIPVRAADLSLAAVLVVGVNPFRPLDDDYRRFLDLLGRQIGSAISRARTLAEERSRAEALAELDRGKTTFFSNISHEFRTPLTLILGPTEDALRAPGAGLSDEALRAVHRNALRLLKLVNALLEFSRIEAGRLQASYELTDLARFTRELACAFRSAFERAGLAFEIDCAAGPPVRVDRAMWEKIVLNLLSNALKFTFEGGVTVRLAQREGVAELVVSDTGIGIPAEELPRLFERFHRVEGARARTQEGSGIGLALVAELVRLHDGSIEVESVVESEIASEVDSESGRGTRFTVRVPAGAAPCTSEAEATSPERLSPRVTAYLEEAMRWLPGEQSELTPSRPGDLSGVLMIPPDVAGAHILVADDNADMRDYLRRLLGTRWTVTVAPDGESALEAAQHTRPDLVLTDMMMPNLDGFGLLRALRTDPGLSTVPVVMLSARAGEEARIEGIEAGADAYLVKPFSARELLARVSNILQLARLRRDVELERNRLAAFIEQTPVAVVLWEGPELRCSLANEAGQRMARRPMTLGAPLRELFPDLTGSASLQAAERVAQGGEPIDIVEDRLILRSPDGALHEGYYNTSYRPLQDAQGRTTGVISVSIEVTEQVRARQAVEASRAEAIVASRSKDEFLAMLGHELRNPLAPILTALELMRLRAGDVAVRERTIIERQTQHLASLVEDLLDVSRIARGMVQLRCERVFLADVIAKAVETAAPLFEQQRHELVTSVPRDLVVDADPGRLTQVFANLLTNAAKYTDPCGRVTIAARREGGEVIASVTDTGRGIAGDMLGRVFELFVQERQNLDRARGGLGLGLAIVRNLVELHGGRVEVSSPGPRQGSTFTVRLPSAPARAESAAGARPAAVPDAAPARAISVLVVDDNVDAATLLGDLLSTRGYQAHVAHDAAEVLRLARDFVPDVALLDIGLPAMDGYELARRLRELPAWRHVRLVALTGYGQGADRERSVEVGFDHHLVKPIDLTTLERYLPPPDGSPGVSRDPG